MRERDIELTPEQIAELEALATMTDDEIDTSDIPKVTDWSNARRGIFRLSPQERREAISELKRTHPRVMDTTEYELETLIYDAITGDLPLSDGRLVRKARQFTAAIGCAANRPIMTASTASIYSSLPPSCRPRSPTLTMLYRSTPTAPRADSSSTYSAQRSVGAV